MAERAREEGKDVAYGAGERWRERNDDGSVRKAEKAHPLAGRSGEGPPLAPPGWRWRTGNRTRDMYFLSPSGQKFRSRRLLQSYLASIPDPPPFSLFRWKVHRNEFKDGELPGVISIHQRPGRRKKEMSDATELSTEKLSVKETGSESEMKLNFNSFENSDGQIHSSKKSPDKIGLTTEVGAETISKKKLDHKRKKAAENTSFTHLLFTPTSYKVLSKDDKALHRFLNEAELLKEKDEKEVGKLREELLMQNCSASQLSKYPESVLRVFFYILRHDEAPTTFETRELIEFCCNWVCKHKHHWCLLETRRLNILENAFTEILIDHDGTVCRDSSTLKEKVCRVIPEGSKVSADQQGTHGANSLHNESVAHSCVGDPAVLGVTSNEDVKEPWLTEDELVPESGEATSRIRAVDSVNGGLSSITADSAMNVDGCYLSKTTQMNNFHVPSQLGKEGTEEAKLGQMHRVLPKEWNPNCNKCNCQVCSSDLSFCYGCMCNLCKSQIQHDQAGTFVKCPICQHLCHLECALKARRAGVITELGMDGELLCLCCSIKSDLVPFWVEMLKNALTSIDRSVVLRYLTSAVIVLNRTERKDFQSVHQRVMELHDSLLYNTPCHNLQGILRQIQEKVDSLSSLLKPTAFVLGVPVQDPELLQEEEKVLEGQAQADLHYVEWLIAEKNADTQRINLRNAQEEMKKSELDISTKAFHARSSRNFLQQAQRRLHLMKQNIAVQALSKEELEKQRAALQLEVMELEKVCNQLGSFSAEPWEISAALQDFKIQSIRVEDMKARLEQIDSLKSFFL